MNACRAAATPHRLRARKNWCRTPLLSVFLSVAKRACAASIPLVDPFAHRVQRLRAHQNGGWIHLAAATRCAQLYVKFELYMTAGQFDGMAQNLQWLGGKTPYKSRS